MIDKLLDPIFGPIRQAWSKFMGAKNVVDGVGGDLKRLKRLPKDVANKAAMAKKAAEDLKKKAKGASDAAKGMAGKAQGAYGQAQGAAAQAQGFMGPGGPPPGTPGGPPLPPPGQPGQAGMMSPPPGMPQHGMPPGMMQPPPPGMMMPPPGGRSGMPPGPMGAAMGGMPQMGGPPMGGAPMGGYGGPAAAPGPGNRTMAIMAGGTSGAAIGWLVPIKGSLRGELITLKPVSVIGKDPTCDVVFNDPFLSGRHATIRAQNGLFVLEDHSTNGTFVNDRKVQRHELVDNDFVKLGQTMMKFKAL